MDFHHVLIATDGSAASNHAVVRGLALAKRLNARVTAVTVSELWSPFEIAARAEEGAPNPIESVQQAAADDAKRILNAVAQIAGRTGVQCDLLHIRDQRPADGIIKAAQDNGCDLIVVGTHGHRGIKRLLLGSQASEVVALANVPVMVCK